MRKKHVWKQALALVVSAALALGGVSPVSAADDSAVTNPDAYKKLEFTFENGQQSVSGDNAIYTENGVTFLNQCSQKVVTDENGQEIATTENPNKSKGVEVVDASDIPDATEADKAHGKVLKFDVGKTNPQTGTDGSITYGYDAGIDYLTTTEGALASYDYSNGVTFSFDIRPEGQRDWNYLFAFGMFGEVKYAMTGAVGLIAGYDSEQKRLDAIDENGSWQDFTPNGNWLPGNEIENNGGWDFFGTANAGQNAHKWYTMEYIYTKNNLTINVNGVPTVTYKDTNGYMEGILKNMSKGRLRIGKGAIEDFEGFVGYMDNVTIQPVHPGAHEYQDIDGSRVEPTCTQEGSKKMKCTMCGEIMEEKIPAAGHTYTQVPAKAATCTENGNHEHYRCSVCSGYFIDGTDGKTQSSESAVTITAAGHKYAAPIITAQATETADGRLTKTCDVCSASADEAIPMASDIALEKTAYTYTGKAHTPEVTVKDSAGNVIDAANYTVAYTDNTKVGTASAVITFRGDRYTGTARRTFKINAVPASLRLNKTKVTLYTGKANTATVKATVTGNSKKASWSTNNKKVATVKNGKITAVGKGTAVITAKANGISKKVTVTVKNPTITVKNGKNIVKNKKTVAVNKKKSVKLTVSVKPKNAGITVKKLSKKENKIASVTYKKGKLTIKGKKKGTITVKITSGKTTHSIKVKVK